MALLLTLTAAPAIAGGGIQHGATATRPRRRRQQVRPPLAAGLRARQALGREDGRCESGKDPKAIGGNGMYRGAFQFMKSTWRVSPKSPGGDPIAYTYKTQAVVAVALKHRDGTRPGPSAARAARPAAHSSGSGHGRKR